MLMESGYGSATSPLTQGLKVFNVKCFEAGKEFKSSQEIYVLGDNMSSKKPIVLKLDSR